MTKQVIERHLIDALPDNIMSPMIITSMTDDEVSTIAAESPDITRQRESLETLRSALEDGRKSLRQMMGSITSSR